MFRFEPLTLAGCYLVDLPNSSDVRGCFVKTFSDAAFSQNLLGEVFQETFVSTSQQNVVRGMHWQKPPHDHAKLVSCISGRILDVVVDLRKSSPTFGEHVAIELDARKPRAMLIGKGLAHGFCSLEDKTITIYQVTSEHSRDHDVGIRWDSFGFRWPVRNPIVSERDQALRPFDRSRDFSEY